MSQVTTPGGGGGVDGSGVADEVTIWANATTLKGETGLTYSASKLSVSNRIDVGDVGAAGTIENTNTNQNLQLEVAGTGLVEVENQTVNGDSTFQVRGNGTGTPKLQLTNNAQAVTMQCDENQKLKVVGGSDDFIFDVSSATGGITFPDGTTQITAAGGGGGGTTIAIFRDEKNANGGAATADTWTTRDLNTEVVNTITGAGLAANVITLPAGTYRDLASAPAYHVDEHLIRLQNTTDATVVAYGTNAYANDTTGGESQTRSLIDYVFTLADTKTLEVQHIVNTSNGIDTNSFGRQNPGAWGVNDFYTQIRIEKE